jgi:hypothetical protein
MKLWSRAYLLKNSEKVNPSEWLASTPHFTCFSIFGHKNGCLLAHELLAHYERYATCPDRTMNHPQVFAQTELLFDLCRLRWVYFRLI